VIARLGEFLASLARVSPPYAPLPFVARSEPDGQTMVLWLTLDGYLLAG